MLTIPSLVKFTSVCSVATSALGFSFGVRAQTGTVKCGMLSNLEGGFKGLNRAL